jgi:myosin-1
MFRLFKEGVEDLVMCSSPSNGELTKQLGARFDRELIYTAIGDVLVSMNPYKYLPITGPEQISFYQNSSGQGAVPPHVYLLAERAYRRLVDDKESQCVIISGESGAGKTVAAKLILNYITTVSPGGSTSISNSGGGGGYEAPPSVPSGPPPRGRGGPPPRGGPGPRQSVRGGPPPRGGPPRGGPGGGRGGARNTVGPGGPGGGGASRSTDQIKKVILDSNPLMEAFGNAKTVRNDNSSRFGKYLEIQFNDASSPVGGVISTFLLEKTRVAFQQRGERNFHIFYQLIAGADINLKNDFGINCDPACFYYLGQSGCTTVDDVDDAKEFQDVKAAMNTVGISEAEQYDIFRTLAGILHLGNIRFQGEPPAQVIDRQPLEAAAAILGVDPNFLEQSLNHRQIQSGSARATQYAVPQNADQASGIRDALAKTLYAKLFDFIVDRINTAMANPANCLVVGVLDIYGFEIFDNNSFEQFCINYVNERLQQIFIDLTVRGEQQEYHEEGMKWKDIKFFDNKIVCELIEGKNPPGIMRILDDNCKSVHALDGAAADAKFMQKLIQVFGSHPHMVVSNTGATAKEFTIKHYAGEVTYNIDDFCFKNNDNLYLSLINCMQTSNVPFLVSLFPEDVADNKQAPTTAGFKIRESANYLVKRLSACTPHYIRCIKSNDKKIPMSFNVARVEHQVKYLGLLENVKVKRAGYAYRHHKDVFLLRFGALVEPPATSIPDFITRVTAKYREIPADEFEEGKTKVFIRSPDTIFIMEEHLFKITDPEGYKMQVRAFKESEKQALAKQGKHGLKPKCYLM